MLQKIWTIAHNRLFITFSDRNIVLIMVAVPIALATIIAFAFGSFSRGGSVIADIPVALVNEDRTVTRDGEPLRLGEIFAQTLVPPDSVPDDRRAENQLWALIDTRVVVEAEEARLGVRNGEYVAAILIPANFTERLTSQSAGDLSRPASIELYSSPEAVIQVSVVRSIVDTIATRIATGQIAIQATTSALNEHSMRDPTLARALATKTAGGASVPDFSSAFVNQQSISIIQQSGRGEPVEFSPFALFGTGQAVFFMMFMAMGGVSGLLYEKRDGILGRTMATPTPRLAILIGKLLGILITCIVQVLLLLVAFTVIDGLMRGGQFRLIFGSNLAGLAATVLAVALAASGCASVLMGVATTPEQAGVIGGLFSMAMGIFGGAFFNTTILGPLSAMSRLTINYWGVDAFTRLAQGNNDIATNLLVLLSIGAVTFAIGYLLVNRRLEG